MTSTTKAARAQHCQDQLASLRALAAELSPEEWAAPTLCTGWDVKTVYAHLLYGRVAGLLGMAVGLARHGGSMDRWGDAASRRYADSLTVDELVAEFGRQTSRWPEKGIAGIEDDGTKLADNVVHELDVRWALGRPATLPADRLAAALTGSVVSTMWGNKGRVKGLRLVATDVAWSHGAGQEVRGPAEHLLLAVNGRRAGLAGLQGDGVAVLAARLAG